MKALDLFCGAGGASMGLHRAGFDVTGIDVKPQPRYPFRFIQGDALQPPVRLSDFDLVWASPPCQGYSVMRHLPWLRDRQYPLLIEPVREMLVASGVNYCIENVVGAPLQAFTLCGHSMGLRVFRHRRFETSFLVLVPPHRSHAGFHVRDGRTLGGRAREMVVRKRLRVSEQCSGHRSREASEESRTALGVPWMRGHEHSQAIPPAYAEHVGHYAMMALQPSA